MKTECYYVVYIYPVEPNLCDIHIVTDSILGEYMVDAKTSPFCKWLEVKILAESRGMCLLNTQKL